MLKWYVSIDVGKKLKVPLMCYLTLSVEKKMMEEMLRIKDVQEFVREVKEVVEGDD
jgi:hypothetical protein